MSLRRPAVVIALTSITAVIALALPAGAAQVSIKQYVNSVCTSLTTFQDDVEGLSEQFQAAVASQTDLEVVKSEFVNLFDSLLVTAQNLNADLQAAGTPKIANGGKIASSLRQGISDMESVISDARDDASALSTANRPQFVNEVQDLEDSLNDAFDIIGDGFDDLDKKYDTRKLEAAQKKDPDCSALN